MAHFDESRSGERAAKNGKDPIASICWVSREERIEFREVIEILSAQTPSQVIPCLDRVVAAVDAGYYAAGMIAYEAAPAFDPAFRVHAPDDWPVLWFQICRQMVRISNSSAPVPAPPVCNWIPRVARPRVMEHLRCIREWIVAGDTYQVNYTFPLESAFAGDPAQWFRHLCLAQQADYAACLQLDAHRWILSASPELFFRLDGHRLETRPMKGTRRRLPLLEEDRKAAARLQASEKERAENVMIVDLLRNDMSRVCEPGSVVVDRLFEVERYPTVWQMTSSIHGHTTASVIDILRALFPSGSITGAPKIRSMEIIRDLEPFPRGIYCGAIGWLAPGRQALFNVAIRTLRLDTDSGQARYSVGAGITYGSGAAAEYEECLAKADVLNRSASAFDILETLRYQGGQYTFLNEHLERMAGSAEYFGFPFDRAAALAALELGNSSIHGHKSAGQNIAWKVRLRLDRNGTFHCQFDLLPAPHPMSVTLAPEPVDETDVYLYHKTTQRQVYARAQAACPGYDEVLLWNRREEITEGTFSTVVVEFDGKRYTPPLSCGLLPGTFRAALLAAGEVRERIILKTDLPRAQGLFLVNSVRGWMPVVSLSPNRPV